MRILFLCHRFPYPPNEGGKIRAFHVIKHLAARHELVIGSLLRTEKEQAEAGGLQAYCSESFAPVVAEKVQLLRMITRLPTSEPSSMGYFFSPELQNWVDRKLANEHFDLIFVHCSSAAQYVADVKGVPKILDFCDMDSAKWLEYARFRAFPLSWGYWIEGQKMARAERALAAKFDISTVATLGELQTLGELAPGAAGDWFSNGVDATYFEPGTEQVEDDLLSFIGRMDYYPNAECMIAFCKDVLPLIRAERPNVRLVIVGANPTSQVRDLEKIPGVSVTGSVPDVRPFVRRSAAMVAPLSIARGTQNKILEAMAMEVPVITTSIAARGVDAKAPEHFLIADGPKAIAASVVKVLSDPDLRSRLAKAGRARVLSHHNWTTCMQRVDKIIDGCRKALAA